MPKRTNDFQRLIALLNKQLAPAGAVVTESNEIRDADGQLREVDVTIEYTVASYRIVIAIECRDHKRRATVEWIEQLSEKYRNTIVSQVVAVSKSGFVNTAIRKAEARGILCLTLEEATDKEWVAYVKSRPAITLKLSEVYPIDVKFITSDNSLPRPELPAMQADEIILLLRSGERMGTIVDIYNHFVSSGGLEGAYLKGPDVPHHYRRELVVKFEEGVHFRDPSGMTHGVAGVVIGVGVKSEGLSLELEAKMYNSIPVAVATADSPSWAAQLAETAAGPALSVQQKSGESGTGIVGVSIIQSPKSS